MASGVMPMVRVLWLLPSCGLEVMTLVLAVLLRWETRAETGVDRRSRFNKARFGGASCSGALTRSSCLGGGRTIGRAGSEAPWEARDAAPALSRSSSTAALICCCYPGPMRRPLRFQAQFVRLCFFLLADVPQRRIFDFDSGVFTCLAPSGLVPDGEMGARARMSQRKIGGVGLDCFFKFLCKVLSRKIRDPAVVSVYLRVLDVNCMPTVI